MAHWSGRNGEVEHGLKTLEDAYNCKELWDVRNGLILRKNEHAIISKLERQKKFTTGFIQYVKKWMRENKDNVLKI